MLNYPHTVILQGLVDRLVVIDRVILAIVYNSDFSDRLPGRTKRLHPLFRRSKPRTERLEAL